MDVDLSFNGFLRRWGLGRLHWVKDHLISWKYVQPLSLEDAVPTDRVKLSVTRSQLQDLPGEDLADALEELSGKEQQALFSALDPDKAAETLSEAEPRAQRQIIEDLPRGAGARHLRRDDRAAARQPLRRRCRSEKMRELTGLAARRARRGRANLLTEREATARDMVVVGASSPGRQGARVADVLREIRGARYEPRSALLHLRRRGRRGAVLAGRRGPARPRARARRDDARRHHDLARGRRRRTTDLREDLEKMFEKYGFRMIPVVDEQDRLFGVIRYKDVMKAAG